METIRWLGYRLEMNDFEKYVYRQLNICGVDTYIIHPGYWNDVINLLNLNRSLCLSIFLTADSVKTVELYPAVVYQPNYLARFRWMPLLCYRDGENFYHVYYHSGWRCRECWYNNGAVIMPMVEADAIYYRSTENPHPPIPQIFRKKACQNCGKMLQNHLIIV